MTTTNTPWMTDAKVVESIEEVFGYSGINSAEVQSGLIIRDKATEHFATIIADLKEKLATQEAARQEWFRKYNEQLDKFMEQSGEVADLTAKVGDSKVEIDRLRKVVYEYGRSHQQQKKSYYEMKNKLQSENTTLRKEIEEWKKCVQKATQQTVDLRKEHRDFIESQTVRVQNKMHKMEKYMDKQREENATLKAEVERLNGEAQAIYEKADNESIVAQMDKDALNAEITRLKAEKDTLAVDLIKFAIYNFIVGYFGDKAKHIKLSREDAELCYEEFKKQKL